MQISFLDESNANPFIVIYVQDITFKCIEKQCFLCSANVSVNVHEGCIQTDISPALKQREGHVGRGVSFQVWDPYIWGILRHKNNVQQFIILWDTILERDNDYDRNYFIFRCNTQ